ncbi:MAG: ATP-binding cassette domain-containing protein [Lachnospiraceae bacterium]
MEQAIEIKHVTKKFGKRGLLSDVNFLAKRGQIIGIAGENGCGKSVLFKMICGLEPYHEGTILVNGQVIGKDVDYPQNVGISINAPGYLEQYSGFQNLKYLAEINHKISDSDIRRTMEKVGLKPEEPLKVKHYSLGMKQKLGIAQAMMEGQDILLLDEIFNGLDYKSNVAVKKLLRRKAEESATILLTSHNFSDLKEMCDQIYLIEDGRIEEIEKITFSVKK